MLSIVFESNITYGYLAEEETSTVRKNQQQNRRHPKKI